MADTNKKVSELETASQVNNTDLMMLSQGSSQSGFASLKTTILAIAQKIASGINFTSDLQTENKTLTGAINEVASGGGGSSTFAGLSDVDIDDSTLANGQVPKWNSTTEKWENGNAGGGSGGHNIIDSNGNEMTDRSGLQFENAYVSDDSTDDKTVVPIYREMTRQEYSQAQDKTGLIVVTDDKAKVVNADSVYPVETSTSEHAYLEGDHLIVDGITYIAIDNIAIGDSLTIGTNIQSETLGTRMNHIEDGIESASTATGTEYSSGVSVANKINSMETNNVQQVAFSNAKLNSAYTLRFEKVGKIVELKTTLYATADIAPNEVIGQAPTGFRPTTDVFGNTKGIDINIAVDGTVSLKNTSATLQAGLWYVLTMVYIV